MYVHASAEVLRMQLWERTSCMRMPSVWSALRVSNQSFECCHFSLTCNCCIMHGCRLTRTARRLLTALWLPTRLPRTRPPMSCPPQTQSAWAWHSTSQSSTMRCSTSPSRHARWPSRCAAASILHTLAWGMKDMFYLAPKMQLGCGHILPMHHMRVHASCPRATGRTPCAAACNVMRRHL